MFEESLSISTENTTKILKQLETKISKYLIHSFKISSDVRYFNSALAIFGGFLYCNIQLEYNKYSNTAAINKYSNTAAITFYFLASIDDSSTDTNYAISINCTISNSLNDKTIIIKSIGSNSITKLDIGKSSQDGIYSIEPTDTFLPDVIKKLFKIIIEIKSKLT